MILLLILHYFSSLISYYLDRNLHFTNFNARGLLVGGRFCWFYLFTEDIVIKRVPYKCALVVTMVSLLPKQVRCICFKSVLILLYSQNRLIQPVVT